MRKISAIFVCFVFVFGCFMFKSSPQKMSFAKTTLPYKAMATMEVDSKRILFSYNENQKLPMASTTKIITAICVIENTKDLNKIIKIPKQAQGIEGSSIYLRTGEHLSIKELLLGLMLSSGNDAAVALAIETSGSVEDFATLANEFCKRVGAENTNIVTPNGLHDENHYTTAKDLAIISCYAMKNEIFREIVATKKATLSNEFFKEPRYIKNKNRLLKELDGCTGIKTGFTKEAGRCLVASRKVNQMEVVCVVLNCGPMFEECSELLKKAGQDFSLCELLPEYNHVGSCEVVNGKQILKINVMNKEGFVYPLTKDEQSLVRVVASFPKTLIAPIEKGQSVGEINIYLSNQLIFSTKIYSIEDVRTINFKDIINKVIEKML